MVDILLPSPKPQIIINRFVFDDKSTIGMLDLDGIFQCNTLEDTVRRIKVPNETAIPAGIYKTILLHHPRFGYTAQLLEVPYFDGIFFHSGNDDIDTHGCIVVGQYDKKVSDWIGQSRTTHKAFIDVLGALNRKEGLLTEIKGGLSKDQMGLAA